MYVLDRYEEGNYIDGGDIGGREGLIICNIGGRNVILMVVIFIAEKG